MIHALIVAAGQGTRMGTARRKQYLALAGRPILVHTLQAFAACPLIEHLLLVVPATDKDVCRQQIVVPAGLQKNVTLVEGGARRQDSVYNGLQAIGADEGVVLIHDGVRPLVSQTLIEDCIAGARQWGACIPTVEVTDTLKVTDSQANVVQTLARHSVHMAQTPQAFALAVIKKAHAEALRLGWQATDDASLVERMGIAVRVIAGSRNNIKITTPDDLTLAEMLYHCKAKTT